MLIFFFNKVLPALYLEAASCSIGATLGLICWPLCERVTCGTESRPLHSTKVQLLYSTQVDVPYPGRHDEYINRSTKGNSANYAYLIIEFFFRSAFFLLF